ncbi:hypothetical protein Tco_1082093 [Tanacetum coccineum]|uniref:Uncharacterized protein n=1 Tax=Tanacetum coccineum TaxID=301880 RepID=A0ABQ5I1H3_9ASTR
MQHVLKSFLHVARHFLAVKVHSFLRIAPGFDLLAAEAPFDSGQADAREVSNGSFLLSSSNYFMRGFLFYIFLKVF